MKEYAQQSRSKSRTLESNPKASRQAPIDVILQQYKARSIQRYAEDKLIQGKFDTAQRKEIYKDELLQGKFEDSPTTKSVQLEEKPNNTGLPDNLKSGIENLSGYSMDNVRVHYNSDKPAQLQALAYTQGSEIHVAPGQEKHLPHEAWHVVQQKQGRVQPTMQMQGVNVNDNKSLEKEADIIGRKALVENNKTSKQFKVQNLTSGVTQRRNQNIIQLAKDDNFSGISMKNHMVYSCSQSSTGAGLAKLLSGIKGLTLVITGTHGDKDGHTVVTHPELLAPRFFHCDVATIGELGSKTVHLLPADNIKDEAQLTEIITTGIFERQQYDNIVLGYCHSRRTYISPSP